MFKLLKLRIRLFAIAAAIVFAIACVASGKGYAADGPASAKNPPEVTASAVAGQQPYHLPPAKLTQAVTLGWVRPLLHFGSELWGVAELWLLLAPGLAARVA